MFDCECFSVGMLYSISPGTIEEKITKTYSVHAVVDQREKTKLPFHEAVSQGIIDADTGGYINNITGEIIPAEEAIRKGTPRSPTSRESILSLQNMPMPDKPVKYGRAFTLRKFSLCLGFDVYITSHVQSDYYRYQNSFPNSSYEYVTF